MSLTPIYFIIAATAFALVGGLWIYRDTKPVKTDKVKNILSILIIMFFAISVGSFISAIASTNVNGKKSERECRDVHGGYMATLNGYDYCFEEPPKLIGKI